MKGRVMFWINLDAQDNLGGVLFKLYGQACQKCSTDDDVHFCPPLWYPEEVSKVSYHGPLNSKFLVLLYTALHFESKLSSKKKKKKKKL